MIYLDYAATTPCAPEVVDAMIPLLRDKFANASSIDHIPGSAARRVVDQAREAVAVLVGAHAEDVIFTSGSTEANNLALSVDVPVFTSPVEHPSILDTFSARANGDDRLLDVDAAGRVDLIAMREALRLSSGSLVSIISTNNETGTEQDVDALARIAREAGVMLHLDATQAVGTRALDINRTDGLVGASVSAHKIYGPKGIGALIATSPLRRRMSAILRGGGHERGFRSGTLNVPGIAGFGVAAALAVRRRDDRRRLLTALRTRFLSELSESLPGQVVETVDANSASPHILSVRFIGVNGRALLRAVRENVAFSLGSACATNKTEPSHVLLALGLDKHAIAETIRVSFAADQTAEDVVAAARMIASAAKDLRSFSLSA